MAGVRQGGETGDRDETIGRVAGNLILLVPGPTLDRTNWDQWAEQGSHDWRARANAVIDELLASYEVDPIETRVHEEIQDLIRHTCLEPDAVLPYLTEAAHG